MSKYQFISMPISSKDVSIRKLGNGLYEASYKSLFKEADGTKRTGEVVLHNLYYKPENNVYEILYYPNENAILTFTIDEVDE